jgi:U4/U6 small nuclear ribonucleoprotein PRP3
VKNLSDPAQRYKVRKNAEQLSLTGVCLLSPAFTLVYVEGAARFVRKYKHLLLTRIAWTEAARARGDAEADGAAPAAPEEPAQSLEDNRCDLVWEGQLRERAFGTFKPKACPTDHLAKETLGPKLHGYWDMAKNYKPEEDEPF